MQLPLFLIPLWSVWATAQVTFGTETITGCRPGSTQLEVGFPSCNEWLDVMAQCATYEEWPPYQKCLCTQDLFDDIVFCSSEYEQCFGAKDSSIEQSIELWHLNCDNYTVTPTTPVPTARKTTYPNDFCGKTVQDECRTGMDLMSECSTAFVTTETAAASISSALEAYTSCACRDSLILAQYTCLVLGRVSCLATSAAATDMDLYDVCTNAVDVIEAAGSVITPTPTLPDDFADTATPTTASSTTATDSGSYSWKAASFAPVHVLALALGVVVLA